MQDLTRSKPAWIITACIVTCFAIALAYAYVPNMRLQARSCNFPSTPGIVTESSVVPSGGYGTALKLRYEYSVAGRTYSGHKVKFTQTNSKLGPYTEYARKCPVGASVTVYYDPQAPKSAALLHGEEHLEDLPHYCFIAVILFGVVLTILAWGRTIRLLLYG